LNLIFSFVSLYVVEHGLQLHRVVHVFLFGKLLQPGVFQGFLSGNSIFGVVSQTLVDQILSLS